MNSYIRLWFYQCKVNWLGGLRIGLSIKSMNWIYLVSLVINPVLPSYHANVCTWNASYEELPRRRCNFLPHFPVQNGWKDEVKKSKWKFSFPWINIIFLQSRLIVVFHSWYLFPFFFCMLVVWSSKYVRWLFCASIFCKW